MSKKDEAYELFSKGKTVDSPEAQALGLAPSTLWKYYRSWNASKEREPDEEREPEGEPAAAGPVLTEDQLAPPPPEPEDEEPAPEVVATLGSLYPGDLYEVDGTAYKFLRVKDDNAVVSLLEWSPSGKDRIEKYTVEMPLNTEVTPL